MESLDDIFGVDPPSIVADDAVAATRNTKALASIGPMPGELAEDGSYTVSYTHLTLPTKRIV